MAAAFCLILVPSIMVFQGIDPNYGQVIQGVLIVVVVMLGGLSCCGRSDDDRDRHARRGRAAPGAGARSGVSS